MKDISYRIIIHMTYSLWRMDIYDGLNYKLYKYWKRNEIK